MTTSVAHKTLFIPMLDFPREVEDESNRWFDRDHVPDRLSCDGFLACERFQLTDIQPPGWNPAEQWAKYLNVYFVSSPEVLASEAYRLNAQGAGNRWSKHRQEYYRATGRGELRSAARTIRSLWVQRPSPWLRPVAIVQPPPRVLYLTLYDIDPEQADEVNRYLDEESVPEWLNCPGFLHCERYVAADPGPTQNPPPTPTQYMDLYDVELAETLSSAPAMLQYACPSERGKQLAGSIKMRYRGVYLQRPSPWAVSLRETGY